MTGMAVTLAALRPGAGVRVVSFMYGAVRGLFGDLGIHEGEAVNPALRPPGIR